MIPTSRLPLPMLLHCGMVLGMILLVQPASAAATSDPWQVLNQAASDPDPADARKHLEALLLEQPNFYAGHYNLGTLLQTSDAEAACQHFIIATSSPQVELAADAWHNLALARWHQGRIEEAVRAAESAQRLRPTDPQEAQLYSELQRTLIVRADEARRQAEEEAKKLHLGQTSLPDAHVAEAYSQQLAAAGGSGPYRFSLGAGGPPPPSANVPVPTSAPLLPPGLMLAGDGRVHGTPQKTGTYDLHIAVQDKAGTIVTGSVTLTIIPAPAITTAEVPEAIARTSYETELTSIGLDLPTWTISGLPKGLALAQPKGVTVQLTGTTTQIGSFLLTITAHDGTRSAQRELTLTVSNLFAPEQVVLPPATAWAPYQFKVGVHGPVQDYTWQGPTQDGISIATDGTHSGTPDKAGEQKLSETINAADGRHRAVTLNLLVNPPPLVDEPGNIDVTQGQALERPIHSSGGTPPLRWHLADGVLPKGMRLDPDGSLRGVATDPGEAGVTVALEDHWHANTQQKLTIVVKKSEKQQDQAKKDQKDQKGSPDQKNGNDQKDQKNQANAQDQQDQKGPHQDGTKGADQAQKKHEDQTAEQKKQGQDHGQGQAAQSGKDQENGAGGSSTQRTGAQDTAAQAQLLNRAAADRWLDQLPKEDRKGLRYQLLDGGQDAPKYQGKPW